MPVSEKGKKKNKVGVWISPQPFVLLGIGYQMTIYSNILSVHMLTWSMLIAVESPRIVEAPALNLFCLYQ